MIFLKPTFTFQRDFLLLIDVKKWISNECSDYKFLHLNICDWFTRSHPSKGENRQEKVLYISRSYRWRNHWFNSGFQSLVVPHIFVWKKNASASVCVESFPELMRLSCINVQVKFGDYFVEGLSYIENSIVKTANG